MKHAAIVLLLLAAACGDDAPETPDAQPPAPDAGPDPRFDDLAAAIEAERVALGASGVAVAVMEDGEVSWSAGFGTKAPDSDEPTRATTLFRIGSVTKMMTATALLQLAASGDVALDAPITDYLPDFQVAGEPGASAIRVEDLLTHTHGMVDYLAIDAPPAADEELYDFLHGFFFRNNVYLMAPPGRLFNYSNPGYYTAGLLVEELAGAPYREVMRDRVFLLLGMERTYFLADEVIADGDYPSGATVDWTDGAGARVATPDAYDNAWARPAGYAWSSVLDLAAFARFVMEGAPDVLPAAELAAMQAEQVDTEELLDLRHYGYGLSVDRGLFLGAGDFREEKIVSHGGAIPGFSALVVTVPRTGFAFIVLANTDGAYFTDSLTLALEQFAGLPPSSTPPDLAEDPADLDRYVGTYFDPYNVGTVVVTRAGDALEVDMPDVDAAGVPYQPVLIPLSKQNYLLRIQGFDLPVTFILDDAGAGEYFRTRAFVARRQTTPMPRLVPRVKLVIPRHRW